MMSARSLDVPARWWPAGAAALCWALAAASAVLWGLHLPRSEPVSSADATLVPVSAVKDTQAIERALGRAPTPDGGAADVLRRFQLMGVIATASGQGSALLAVDGQPPQAFVQGQSVAEGWRLQSVSETGVRLSAGQAGAGLEVTLPTPP